MDRRKFVTGSLAGGASLIAQQASTDEDKGQTAPKQSSQLILTPPMMMAPSAESADVLWAVDRLSRGWVECQDESGKTQLFHTDGHGFYPQSSTLIKVQLSGLTPGKTYRIRAVCEAMDGDPQREESPWKTLKTLDPAASETHFSVWNDTHQNNETLQELHRQTPSTDFLVWNGDTCNNWDSEDLLAPTLLHPAGNDISEGRPVQLTWGNHDVRGKFAFAASPYFCSPSGRPFHALRCGPVAAIFLCTGEDKPDDHPSFAGRVSFAALREEQGRWLHEIIQSPGIKDAPYRVVFCHIPLRLEEEKPVNYDTGGFDHYSKSSRDHWHAALVKWGAQVIISGHTHRDSWVPASKDFPYAQLISGGPKREAARWIEGLADAKNLRLIMRNLDKEIVREYEFSRLVDS